MGKDLISRQRDEGEVLCAGTASAVHQIYYGLQAGGGEDFTYIRTHARTHTHTHIHTHIRTSVFRFIQGNSVRGNVMT